MSARDEVQSERILFLEGNDDIGTFLCVTETVAVFRTPTWNHVLFLSSSRSQWAVGAATNPSPVSKWPQAVAALSRMAREGTLPALHPGSKLIVHTSPSSRGCLFVVTLTKTNKKKHLILLTRSLIPGRAYGPKIVTATISAHCLNQDVELLLSVLFIVCKELRWHFVVLFLICVFARVWKTQYFDVFSLFYQSYLKIKCCTHTCTHTFHRVQWRFYKKSNSNIHYNIK